MVQLTVISVGNLKESYWREALSEYEKRLSAFCKLNLLELKEKKVGDSPSEGEIRTALEEEGERILAVLPEKSFKIALCVEGTQYSSRELAERLEKVAAEQGAVCLVIGSSHGLADKVKNACQLRLSVSKLTFPHQMMRVMLLEILYRCFNIQKGTKYHK